jgi:hypothetical protein
MADQHPGRFRLRRSHSSRPGSGPKRSTTMPDPPATSRPGRNGPEPKGSRRSTGTTAGIEDPDGEGPRLYFQKVPEGKVAKNRVHLDLNVSGGRAVSLEERKASHLAEVERLKALGADDHRGAIDKDGEFWVRMNDPEGNEFCVQ